MSKTNLDGQKGNYDQFYRLIRDRRNQLVAHYDGQGAEYNEPAPGITTMKLLGANLIREERDRLAQVVSAMLTFVETMLWPPTTA